MGEGGREGGLAGIEWVESVQGRLQARVGASVAVVGVVALPTGRARLPTALKPKSRLRLSKRPLVLVAVRFASKYSSPAGGGVASCTSTRDS